jgi:hypothetical protein
MRIAVSGDGQPFQVGSVFRSATLLVVAIRNGGFG